MTPQSSGFAENFYPWGLVESITAGETEKDRNIVECLQTSVDKNPDVKSERIEGHTVYSYKGARFMFEWLDRCPCGKGLVVHKTRAEAERSNP